MVKNERVISYKSKDGTELCGIIRESAEPKGTALLAHGITMNKDEWNNFHVKIADKLSIENITSLRFDFRAHGDSGGKEEEMTVTGCLYDIEASMDILTKEGIAEGVIIATSFGAGPAVMYAARNKKKVKKLILLCPVLDYVSTFLKPIVPWAKESFNDKGYEMLKKEGFLLLDGEFRIGAKLVEEFKHIKPFKELIENVACPTTIIHGDKDYMVPYEVSKMVSSQSSRINLITIGGADHGFIDDGDYDGISPKSRQNISNVIDIIAKCVVDEQ